jgi:glutaminyl-tRNA synthetase
LTLIEATHTAARCDGAQVDYIELFNPNSLEICTGALVESHAAKQPPLTHYQFTRMGYYVTDKFSTETKPVFNQVCALKESAVKKAR